MQLTDKQRNALREGAAILMRGPISPKDLSLFKSKVIQLVETIKAEYPDADPDLLAAFMVDISYIVGSLMGVSLVEVSKNLDTTFRVYSVGAAQMAGAIDLSNNDTKANDPASYLKPGERGPYL